MWVTNTLPGEYVTPLQDLIDRCECTRGNITDAYCIILITICHWVPLATRSSFSLSPLARSTFHKNNLYFYFFRLTNNVHDIFLFFFSSLTYVRFSYELTFSRTALCFARRLKITALAAAARKCVCCVCVCVYICICINIHVYSYKYIFIHIIYTYIYAFVFICMYIYLFIILLLSLCILVPCPRG